MQPREKVFRKLPVRLTQDELASRRDELAGAVTSIARLKAEKADVTKGFNEEIKVLQGQAETLAQSIETRQVDRDVECDVYFDVPRGKAVMVRLDSGKIIGVRNLTENEKQLVLGEEVDVLDAELYDAMVNFEEQMKEGEQPDGIEDAAE